MIYYCGECGKECEIDWKIEEESQGADEFEQTTLVGTPQSECCEAEVFDDANFTIPCSAVCDPSEFHDDGGFDE